MDSNPRAEHGAPIGGQITERQKIESRIKTLATIQLAFGGFGVFGLLNTLLQSKTTSEPMLKKMYAAMWTGSMGTWMTISTVVGALLVALLLTAGWTMLKRRPVARILTLAHAVGALLANIASIFVTMAVLGPFLDEVAAELGPAGGIFKTAMQGGLLVGGLMGVAFPICEWYLVTRPGMRDVLEGR